jgi:HlyD family secretion protein
MKRWLWIIGLGVVAIVGIVMGLRPQPVPVETARVTRGPLRVTVEEEGKTRLRSRYIVSVPVAGFMGRLKLKAGDHVNSGDVITRLSPVNAPFLDVRTRDTAEARVNVAEASLEAAQARVHVAESALRVVQSQVGPLEEQQRSAQADLDYWKREQTRTETLVNSGDLPAQQLDRTRTETARAEAAVGTAKRRVETARVQIDSASAEVAAARAQLRPAQADVTAAKAQLRSAASGGDAGVETIPVVVPAGGRVIRVIQESEGVVTPGTPLIEVGNANAIEVEVEVLSPDAVQMDPGTRVLLTGWGGPGTLEARVRVVEPGGFTKTSALGVEEQRVRVIADITSPEQEWKKLGDGYRVEASFVLWEANHVLQVPANALFRHGDGWSVFVIEQDIAKRKIVEVGHQTGLAAEILTGLKEGDTVVAHPDETVEDGKTVASK